MPNYHPRVKVRLNRQAVYSWTARNNITLSEMSRRLRIAPSYLSQMIWERRYVPPELRKKMGALTNLDWDVLFDLVLKKRKR